MCLADVFKPPAGLDSTSPFDQEWADYWCKRNFFPQEIIDGRRLGIWQMHREKIARLLGRLLTEDEWEKFRKMIVDGKSDDDIQKAIKAIKNSATPAPRTS